jgi:hypothetical protein
MGRIEESCVAVDWINYQRVPSQPDHAPGLFLEGMVNVCDSHSRYRIIGPPTLLCLGKVVKAFSGTAASLQEKVSESWECVWKACSDTWSMVPGGESQLSPKTNTARLRRAFTQQSLVALVDVIRNIRAISFVPDQGGMVTSASGLYDGNPEGYVSPFLPRFIFLDDIQVF